MALGLSFLFTTLACALSFRILSEARPAPMLTFLLPTNVILLKILLPGESFLIQHGVGMDIIGAFLIATDRRLLPGGT